MEPLITFIATAFNEPAHQCLFVDAMRNQTDKNFEAIVYHNGHSSLLSAYIDGIEEIEYEESDINTGMWGTVNRQTAIEECNTGYIIQTSVQDYWLPQAVEYINKLLSEQKPDILLWNSINHLVGPCQVLDAQLAWSKVDWGNFAIRTDIAKKVGIQHGDKYTADWLFIQDVMNSGLVDQSKIIKCQGIFTIHN